MYYLFSVYLKLGRYCNFGEKKIRYSSARGLKKRLEKFVCVIYNRVDPNRVIQLNGVYNLIHFVIGSDV